MTLRSYWSWPFHHQADPLELPFPDAVDAFRGQLSCASRAAAARGRRGGQLPERWHRLVVDRRLAAPMVEDCEPTRSPSRTIPTTSAEYREIVARHCATRHATVECRDMDVEECFERRGVERRDAAVPDRSAPMHLLSQRVGATASRSCSPGKAPTRSSSATICSGSEDPPLLAPAAHGRRRAPSSSRGSTPTCRSSPIHASRTWRSVVRPVAPLGFPFYSPEIRWANNAANKIYFSEPVTSASPATTTEEDLGRVAAGRLLRRRRHQARPVPRGRDAASADTTVLAAGEICTVDRSHSAEQRCLPGSRARRLRQPPASRPQLAGLRDKSASYGRAPCATGSPRGCRHNGRRFAYQAPRSAPSRAPRRRARVDLAQRLPRRPKRSPPAGLVRPRGRRAAAPGRSGSRASRAARHAGRLMAFDRAVDSPPKHLPSAILGRRTRQKVRAASPGRLKARSRRSALTPSRIDRDVARGLSPGDKDRDLWPGSAIGSLAIGRCTARHPTVTSRSSGARVLRPRTIGPSPSSTPSSRTEMFGGLDMPET